MREHCTRLGLLRAAENRGQHTSCGPTGSPEGKLQDSGSCSKSLRVQEAGEPRCPVRFEILSHIPEKRPNLAAILEKRSAQGPLRLDQPVAVVRLLQPCNMR